jgi:hypothetical protein
MNYPAIAAALHDAPYIGVVGLQAWAPGDGDIALQRFGDAFMPRREGVAWPEDTVARPAARVGHATSRTLGGMWVMPGS